LCILTGKRNSYSSDHLNQVVRQESGLFCDCNKNALHFYFCTSQDSGGNQPKADIVVPVVGIVVVTTNRLRVLSRIVPTAAAFHAVIAGDSTF